MAKKKTTRKTDLGSYVALNSQGTPVASIACGSHSDEAMREIAPGCTFLPIQRPFGRSESFVSSTGMPGVFEFVSARGSVRAIGVEVEITHTYRGDLRVNLVSPEASWPSCTAWKAHRATT